jgi:hypothetical protein
LYVAREERFIVRMKTESVAIVTPEAVTAAAPSTPAAYSNVSGFHGNSIGSTVFSPVIHLGSLASAPMPSPTLRREINDSPVRVHHEPSRFMFWWPRSTTTLDGTRLSAKTRETWRLGNTNRLTISGGT